MSKRSIRLSMRKTSTRRNLGDDGWEDKQFSFPNDLEIPTEMSERSYRCRDGQIYPLGRGLPAQAKADQNNLYKPWQILAYLFYKQLSEATKSKS
tara:strand:- start:233 stop:517 length:285 start_codon:yes stop_codon:yes gene_type:complete